MYRADTSGEICRTKEGAADAYRLEVDIPGVGLGQQIDNAGLLGQQRAAGFDG
ncbi:hypothetical protein [Zoogloea sp. LCSB751]|uniref:hypothetical protein n=1 Tax=Zoogloea sp. LCSB751 TaxID=1965277 RepID=UPI00137478EB|nr:hypothetical protein [Zoogloea sp. LCSB751]